MRARLEAERIQAIADRFEWIAEYVADSKANAECTLEFWGIWRTQYNQDKVADLLFQIKNLSVTIDKLRKNKR